MKGLSQYLSFDWNSFANGKVFISTSVSEYLDYTTKKHLGTKVEAVIAEDRTPYQFKNGQSFTNRFEKVTFKAEKDVNIPVNVQIVPKGVTATIYGDYHNQLSLKCEDIEVVAAAKEKN